ncbi:unnamed protein product [Lampetra planeri]
MIEQWNGLVVPVSWGRIFSMELTVNMPISFLVTFVLISTSEQRQVQSSTKTLNHVDCDVSDTISTFARYSTMRIKELA